MSSASKVEAGFQRKEVFAQLRAANQAHHQEALAVLNEVLALRQTAPLRVLDIGCGDARDIASLLANYPVQAYVGIDNDPEAITSARDALSILASPPSLLEMDYQAGLDSLDGPFDLVWMGLFLHHLSSERKGAFFRQIIDLLAPGGCVITHDPLLREGETRQAFLRRIAAAQREELGLLSEADRAALQQHWAERGHQEAFAPIRAAAEAAGFRGSKILWRDPQECFAVLCFARA